MEYHEIGERFEYDGVMLEVVERTHVEDCKKCYFANECIKRSHGYSNPFQCYFLFRDSNDSVYFKLVEQCKTKDMKQKTEFEEVKSFSNSLKFVVDDYGLMRDVISIIYHTIKEDNIDIGKLYFRFTDNEVRVMVMEILRDIVELKKRSNGMDK